MGRIKHDSIIVTGYDEDVLAAREECIHIFRNELDEFENPENIISPIMTGLVNGQHSFFIAPDGSKEGWDTSNNCDVAREKFIKWFKEFGKGIDIISLNFGGDDEYNSITYCSNND